MKYRELLSDQLFMWSVINDRTNYRRSEETSRALAPQVAASGLSPSGLLDRALQALRQSQLQVCERTRSRAQILPLCELPGQLAPNGLRPAGRVRAGQRVLGQLHPDSADPGRDLRDQSRTATSARAALRGRGEPGLPDAHPPLRSARWRSASGQHADRLDRRRADAHALRGGQS